MAVKFIEAHFMRWAKDASVTSGRREAERCFGHEDWESLTRGKKKFSVIVSNSSGDLKIDLTNRRE